MAGYPARPGGPPTGGFFARIRDWGFAPHMILDVGANEGNWAREIWSYFGNIPGRANPTVIMFEGSQHRRQVGDTVHVLDTCSSARHLRCSIADVDAMTFITTHAQLIPCIPYAYAASIVTATSRRPS